MAWPRIGGPGVGLDLSASQAYWARVANGGAGYPFNAVTLAAGETQWVPPGIWQVTPGPYSFLQFRDPVTGLFRSTDQAGNQSRVVESDGWNWRLANLTGCAMGALVTNSGSGYTSAPTVTAGGSGASTWKAIVGGAINSSPTITAGGTGYLYPPLLIVQAPPQGGIPATMTCTLSAGAINAVTVTNNGAGYSAAPLVLVINDPRDTVGSGAVITNALAGTGEVTAVVCTNHGIPVTAVTALTFTGGGGSSAAATAVMCFTATGFSVGTAGTTFGNAQPFGLVIMGGITAGTAGTNAVNPAMSTGLLTPRMGSITGTSTSGGGLQTTGSVIADGGLFQAVPQGMPVGQGSGGIVTITVGGVADTSILQGI